MVQVTQADGAAVLIDQLVLIVDGIVVNCKNARRIKNSWDSNFIQLFDLGEELILRMLNGIREWK
jgi:hypothetical protein